MPLARKTINLFDVGDDVIALMRDLANTDRRDAILSTTPITKYEAYNLRMRVYRWRRKILDAISEGPASEIARTTESLLINLLGGRATRQWLHLTVFQCKPVDADRWQLHARVRLPLYGP